MIRLRFVTGADPVSDVIRFAEYGFWATHVDAVMPDGRLLGAHFRGGVANRAAGYDAGQRTRELVIALPASEQEAAGFHGFLLAQVGKPYDTEAIAAFVARRNWNADDAWFCSELIAAALVHCGWFSTALAVTANKIMPRDLLLIISGRVAVPA